MNATKTQELVTRRLKAASEARQYVDRAGAEKRSMSGMERDAFDRCMTVVESIGDAIRADGCEYRNRMIDTEAYGDSEKRHAAFIHGLGVGEGQLTKDELRALATDNQIEGGFLTVPIQTTIEVLTKLDSLVFVRNKGTVLPPIAATASAVPFVDNPSDAEWTTEISAAGWDSAMTAGSRNLKPHPLVRGIKVSNRLLRTSEGRAESIVTDRLAAALALPQEKAFLTGSGAGQPLGLFTANVQGIDTSRDIATGSTATSVTYDSFAAAFFNLESQYQQRAEWILHREVCRQAVQLKDSTGRPLFQFATEPGKPDTILGRTVNQSEHAPNTLTTGQYVGIFGDLRYYYIQDARPEVQRLAELFAETSQTGFIARAFNDGMPALAEAFTRMKLG